MKYYIGIDLGTTNSAICSYDGSNIRIWKSLMCLLFLFYIVEAGLAVYERLTWHLVFGWANIHTVGMNVTATDFRSTALLGHPLANALIVSTIMSFFLVSPLNSKYKYLLWFLGFVAILCFNARAAIIGNVVVFLVYLIYTLQFNDKISSQEKNRIFWGVLLLAVLGIYLMANGYVGGRFLESGVNDESSQVRIDIWNVFMKYDLISFMFGVSSHDLDMILNSLSIFFRRLTFMESVLPSTEEIEADFTPTQSLNFV